MKKRQMVAAGAVIAGLFVSGCASTDVAQTPGDKSAPTAEQAVTGSQPAVVNQWLILTVTTVEDTPLRAELNIDGALVGSTDKEGKLNIRIPSGVRRAKLVAAGFEPWEKELNMMGAGQQKLTVQMKPAAPAK